MRRTWQQAEGQRHAFDAARHAITPNEPFATLCGKWVTPQKKDITTLGGYAFDPTCLVCNAAWIAADAAEGVR